MNKETSCINSAAILDYLKAKGIDYADMIRDLDPEIDILEDPESFLRDPDNWISTGVITRLFERATRLLDDDQAAYKMGRYVTENTRLGFAQRVLVKALWSIKRALRHSQKINDQFNTSKKVELVQVKRNEATVRLHWTPGMETSKYICQYNQGVYSYLPLIWGGSRLSLNEKCCYFDGAPYCEYHLKWPLRNRFHEIISRFFVSRSVLADTIREIEKDKKLIHQKNAELKSINEELKIKIAQHKRAEESLRKSEEKYRLLTENVIDVIWTTDMDLNYTYISPAIEKIHGWSAEEAASLTINDILTPESIEIILRRIESHIAHCAKTGNYQISDRLELELYRKDGTTIWTEISASSILGEDGKPVGILGITRDITERKKLEIQLQRAQKMEAIGTLAGGVAHDLNNILSAQVSYPDLILMDLPEDSPLRNPILTIQKSGKKAAAIVQDLLTLARRGVAATEVINLNTIIDDYIKSPECENLMAFHDGVRIRGDLDPNLLNIMGSSVHLSKALTNLVSNAAEAMPGGGNILISTSCKYIDKPIQGYDDVKEGDYAILTVSDTGMGISSDDLEKIFDPFYTKKEMGRSGSGLGMTVVWGTVKDHKGYINVQSTERKGTRFTLYFPITRKEIDGKEETVPIEEYMGNGQSILVIDDVEEQLEIACRILNKLGYSVASVSSGEEAIDYLKNNSAELLVLDMIMDPGMDGLETYKNILKLYPKQKAIIASGFSETNRVKEVQALGAGKYIKKPYTIENIGLAIKEEIGR